MIPLLKVLHIAALVIWCAGLLGMPALIVQHARATTQDEFGQLRRFVRRLYVFGLTPAAVVAVAAGTGLIFAREVFVGWMFLKLVIVGLLVGLHAFQANLLLEMADAEPEIRPWQGAALTGAALALMVVILALVLGKPPIDTDLFPSWLLEPRDGQLPWSEAMPT